MNARDFDDADVSSRSILRSSQPCFPEILECDGHANATRRCSRDKFVLFDIMWLAVILGWNFPSNPEANYSENVLAECFPADRNPHNFWVGVCEPTLDSRSTPRLSECVDNFDQPTDVDLDSGPGSSWTVPKLWLASDEARLLSVWTPVLLLCWKRKWIFISSFLPEAFEPSLTGIWKVMETPGSHWGTTCPGAAATSTLYCTSAAREQSCLHQTKMVELRWSTRAPAEHKTFSKTHLKTFCTWLTLLLFFQRSVGFRDALGLLEVDWASNVWFPTVLKQSSLYGHRGATFSPLGEDFLQTVDFAGNRRDEPFVHLALASSELLFDERTDCMWHECWRKKDLLLICSFAM